MRRAGPVFCPCRRWDCNEAASVLVSPRPGRLDSLAELTCLRHRARTRSLLGQPGRWPVPDVSAVERKALWS